MNCLTSFCVHSVGIIEPTLLCFRIPAVILLHVESKTKSSDKGPRKKEGIDRCQRRFGDGGIRLCMVYGQSYGMHMQPGMTTVVYSTVRYLLLITLVTLSGDDFVFDYRYVAVRGF